ncbi:putative 2-dehydropantoate 2-reductase [Rosellinia necatrix]|uniref:Putative 2-dehydropantoate 2-reductase n=1 Tax=Rosellinia necatrix TaxID=77044 RepID=A0A1W2TJI4_ROSNE|nr:putative 2-dehydropantoate 2-reductase [Rosellinia necatrix]
MATPDPKHVGGISSSSSSNGSSTSTSTNGSTSTSPTRPVHILFVGAGAVGCFYASRLHHPSHNVYTSLTARSNYAAIASSGVTLQTRSFGDYTFHPHAVFPSVAAAVAGAPPKRNTSSSSSTGDDDENNEEGGWDYVVVTTKALPDRTDDAAMIAPLVTPRRTCVVLIQNGVGVEAPYRARFPANPIVSGVTVVSAEQTSPGVVRQNRWTRISLGPYVRGLQPNTPTSTSTATATANANANANANTDTNTDDDDLAARGQACMERLAGWWTSPGGLRDAEPHTERELQAIRWHKLCINAAFNSTAVLSGGRGNADQLTDAELRRHVAGVMREVWDAAPAVLGGPSFPPEGLGGLATPERILRSTERNPGARPSMLLDWDAGRPMELEVILGNPVRLARAAGVEMPRLQSLYALLRSMQAVREAARPREGKL